VRAVALYGLNPLVVVYGVGGGHNDLLMVALLVVGVLMLLSGRERSGAGGLVAAAGIKLTAVVVLPFALAGQAGRLRERRRRLLVGGGTMLLALGAVSYALFGIGSLHLLSTIHRSQSLGDWHSIPGFVASRFGGSGRIGQLAGLSLDVAFVAGLGVLLRRVLRGELDWVAAAGWATVLMLVTATSLLPWYVAWLLPLAALGGDRRLYRWAFGLTVLVQAINLLGYLPHGSALLGL
jgi:alpha-1,6-mannosyltransferase